MELGRNPVSKRHIQPEYGDEQADARRDCRTRLARPRSHARTNADREIFIFPVQLTTSRIGNLARLVHTTLSRALSLRNLVSGYECGRVFPAGVGPGSPSRDAANWLPSRFSLSVETRRRYGWLRMVFLGARLFRAPIWCPLGGWRQARSWKHCRGEPGSALSGGYAPDSAMGGGQLDRRRARGGLNPSARESQA